MLDSAVALRHPCDERAAGHRALEAGGTIRVVGLVRLDALVVCLLDALLARIGDPGVLLLAQLGVEGFGGIVGKDGLIVLTAGVEFVFDARGAHILIGVGRLTE